MLTGFDYFCDMSPGALIQKYITFFQFPVHRAFMRHKLRKYGDRFHGNVLDIGAGDAPYRDFFPSVTSYQTTNARSHYCEQATALEPLTDHWLEDATELPFSDHSFDGILCFQVLSVVHPVEKFFSETFRILQPGGLCVITTDYIYPSWSGSDAGRYSISVLQKMAEQAGFRVAETESFGGYACLEYSIHARRVRDLPASIRAENSGIRKCILGLRFLWELTLLPRNYVRGWILFQWEKHMVRQTGNTFNFLLLLEKPAA